ncbi:hypothetical protein BDZ89DRAFT_1158523 [Hymenopellis radicata]|nr:hypothetical protein BDZ89DRAFT_1158523 [Hymenopellis radicata]
MTANSNDLLPPPWFQAWIATQFQPLVRNVTMLLIRDAKDQNLVSSIGDNGPFVEVPFPDGRMPWGLNVPVPNHGNITLPPLNNVAAIRALTLPQSYGYYYGYYPNQPVGLLDAGPDTSAHRIERIASAIGRALS